MMQYGVIWLLSQQFRSELGYPPGTLLDGDKVRLYAMVTPILLWFDCTTDNQPSELREQSEQFFSVHWSSRPEHALHEIAHVRPAALCFDFDYPDQMRLRMLQALKRDHMSLPILMLTVAHSEALAIWAFRARMWNYLVKPIVPREYLDNLRALAQIAGSERRATRAVIPPEPRMPNEIASRSSEDPKSLLRPAIYYIEQHFHERVSASNVARLCGMSRFRFSRLFHLAHGVTFQEYLLEYRIAQACRMLQQLSASVTEVGYAAGFNDASYFGRIFKRYAAMAPSEYVRHVQQEAQPS